jgi:hypothetical protein
MNWTLTCRTTTAMNQAAMASDNSDQKNDKCQEESRYVFYNGNAQFQST